MILDLSQRRLDARTVNMDFENEEFENGDDIQSEEDIVVHALNLAGSVRFISLLSQNIFRLGCPCCNDIDN
jgi:hypothetical protein